MRQSKLELNAVGTALGALAMAAAATASYAQSSVTITGVMDRSVRVVHNDSSKTTLGSNGVSASNISFRGVEDLGDGLRASFWLEATPSETSGISFDRKSTVGLIDARVGEIRMGRDYVPTYANISRYDPLKANGVGNANNLEPTNNSLGSTASTVLRANSTVSYFTPPTLGGFFAHVMASPDDDAVGGKYKGARVGYASKAFELAVSIGATKGDNAGNDFKVVNVGGMYDLGYVRPMAFWQKATFKERRQDNYLVGLAAPVGVGEVRVSYQRANQSGAGTDANDATQLALSYFHALSKRTGLYATTSHVKNRGAQTYKASGSGGQLTAGANSTGTEVGITHSF